MVVKNIFKIVILMLCVLYVSSCEKDGGRITLDKDVIEVGAVAGSFVIKVETDGAWSVRATNSSGFNISWITPRPYSGKGFATVNLQFKENDTYEVRTANVIFTSGTGQTATVKVKQKIKTTGDMAEVRIGNFNVRIASESDAESGNGWDVRKERLISAINKIDFDIFGLQEVGGKNNVGIATGQQTFLVDRLGDRYEFKFFSPYSQDGIGKSSNGFAYKKDKFIISNYKYFWASNTPDVMSYNDGTHSRGGCCAVITHKETGLQFFFMEAHAALDKDINCEQASVYPRIEEIYNPGGLPSVFVGDLNHYETSDAYKTYVTWWTDAYAYLLPSNKCSGPSGTYNGFELTRDMNRAGRIDYIFFRGNIVPTSYVCDDSLYDGYYPSDHLPIYCDFELSSNE